MSSVSGFTIGTYSFDNRLIAAPMAGVSDKPYRALCRDYGASLAISEMVTSKTDLHLSTKSRQRMDLRGETTPVAVQIVGTDPQQMAVAAKANVANGADLIDINMGCPAKKVCKKAAGSTLLANETRVQQILASVVAAVDVPVTVKIRTGISPDKRNGVRIAQIAEQAGVQAITIHGRTRECKFVGAVEYDTIANIKQTVSIPVIANGDISSAEQAQTVLNYTAADAIMIGRAAQGQPWLFAQIAYYLQHYQHKPQPDLYQRALVIKQHIAAIHDFYGAALGLRLARKHIKWYLQKNDFSVTTESLSALLKTEHSTQQIKLLNQILQPYLLPSAA